MPWFNCFFSSPFKWHIHCFPMHLHVIGFSELSAVNCANSPLGEKSEKWHTVW